MNTVQIHGSDGEILVPFCTSGTFIRGKRIGLLITGTSSDPKTPAVVKEALIGLPVDALFTREQIIEQCGKIFAETLPEGCLIASAEEVIAVLESANRYDAAHALKEIAPGDLDLYVFEKDTFRLLP